MIDVAVAIDAEAEPVTIRSFSSGAYDEGGNWIAGIAVETVIGAVVQPVSGKALLDLPEGIRSSVSFVGWSRSTVALTNEIVYGGANYRVAHLWPRASNGFYKFALSEVVQVE